MVADEEGFSVYFTINPTDTFSVRWADRFNQVAPGRALQDDQVVARKLLLIDADPVRPAGVCSTASEKAAAHAAAGGVVDYLNQQGWPVPVVADSGNGAHLLYRISLPADDGGLVHRALQAIDAKFTTNAVKFDTTVGNASRICRLYGTHNRKGPNTKQRPHRLAAILTAPTELAIVTRELLEELAAFAPVQPPRTSLSRELVPVMSTPRPLLVSPPTAHAEAVNRARAQLHTPSPCRVRMAANAASGRRAYLSLIMV